MKFPIITKKYHFCASHKYGNDYWDEEKNFQVFGKDFNNHGHNYVLEVSVSSAVNPDTGWSVDLQELNKVVKTNVVNISDHSQIEEDIKYFNDRQPSSEELVVWIWDQIEKDFKDSGLYKIRLVETHSIHTDYYGPH